MNQGADPSDITFDGRLGDTNQGAGLGDLIISRCSSSGGLCCRGGVCPDGGGRGCERGSDGGEDP